MSKARKVVNKNGNISEVSKKLEIFKLIDSYKNAGLKEFKLRNKAAESLESFKKGYFAYLLANELDDKVDVIKSTYQDKEDKTDQEKDGLQEFSRAQSELDEYPDEKVPNLDDMFVKNEKKIRSYLKDEQLAKYKTKIEVEFLAGAKHFLNEKNRSINRAMGDIQSYLDIYRAARDDFNPTRVYDKDGRKFTKVTGNDLFTHIDPNVRRDTYFSYYSFENTHRRLLLETVFYIARRNHQKAKLHNYDNEIDYIVGNIYHISKKNFGKIIDESEKFTKLNLKFRLHNEKIIKYAYDFETFEPWDGCLKIKDVFEETDIPTVKKLVIESLSCLGKDYTDKVFDVYKKPIIKGKGVNEDELNGGCLSGVNTLDENPIIIKGDGKMLAAITLSHELGHNLKNVYGKLNNEINNNIDRLNCEIPSIVNQVITCLYLIDKYKAEKKPTLLYGVYKTFIGYLLKNISKGGFYMEFYDGLVNYFVKGKEFKPLSIEKMYLDGLRQYVGLTSNEYKRMYKGKEPYGQYRLSGFTRYIAMNGNGCYRELSYYVGSIIALPVAYKIYKGDKAMLNKYMKFLKAENSTDPLKPLKILGIDITKPRIYTETKEILNKLINQFIKDIVVEQPKQK